MKNLIYKISGYDPNMVRAGQLGAKFLLPGLSLVIVLITSFYGGYHLADTITSGWYRIPFTIGFVSLILLVDYLLLQGEKSKWTALMRVILSITMGFIISLLTCLVVFESDIEAKYTTNITSEIKEETATRERDIAYWKTLPDSIRKYNNLSVTAHKGDYITEHGERVGRCKDLDQSKCPEGTYCRIFKNMADSYKHEYDDNKHLINDSTYINNATSRIVSRNSKGIIGQIENLWNLMMQESVVLVGVVLFFIFLMVIDLMPISVKFGIKETLDNEYKEFLNELHAAKDATGNPRWLNPAMEALLQKSERERAIMEYEKQKEIEKIQRKRKVNSKVEALKEKYALTKLQSVEDKIH
jgi:energy-coupling factor transporter transmembrane protein EcfT